MSWSAGTGSPVSFVCPIARRNQVFDPDRSRVRRACWAYPKGHETITLTGRERPYRANRGSALGLRSTTTAREYVCSCGHVGWSNHVSLERAARDGIELAAVAV